MPFLSPERQLGWMENPEEDKQPSGGRGWPEGVQPDPWMWLHCEYIHIHIQTSLDIKYTYIHIVTHIHQHIHIIYINTYTQPRL